VKRTTRRAFVVGGVGIAAATALEYVSFRGTFDHRWAPAPKARDRYAESIRRLEDPLVGAGSIVHVGHSTHLISVAGVRMLTDPWFYDPAFGALRHSPAPATDPESIGALDALLVTHDHADHADPRAMDRLDKRALALVATSELEARAKQLGYTRVARLAAWESLTLRGVTITAVPAVHDVYEVGYIVEGAGRSLYFAGDTRLNDALPVIAERFRPTMAILPVDGTRLTGGERWVMTPDDAVTAADTLGVAAAMPSHAESVFSDPIASTFLASTIAGAAEKFGAAMARSLPNVRCSVPASGEIIAIPARS
jgi:L-ascorbate metabolism protein UlaG (beta-lactamase superfamily)